MTIKFFNGLMAFAFFFFLGCSDKCERGSSCDLKPDAGDCEAAIPRYYYDQDDQECKEFSWGGCDGVVPYETLEACKADCHCED